MELNDAQKETVIRLHRRRSLLSPRAVLAATLGAAT